MGDVLRVNQERPESGVVEATAKVFAAGGVVVVPTDSVYGIGCAALPNNPGLERTFAIKHRDHAQTLPWLVADLDDLDRFGADVSDRARRMAAAYWPGALTLVVRASKAVPAEYCDARGTIALRLPASELVRQLARAVGSPLAITSANTHGKAAAVSGASVEPRIVREADLVLDAGPAPLAVASTIVDVTAEPPRILREGAIPASELLAV